MRCNLKKEFLRDVPLVEKIRLTFIVTPAINKQKSNTRRRNNCNKFFKWENLGEESFYIEDYLLIIMEEKWINYIINVENLQELFEIEGHAEIYKK